MHSYALLAKYRISSDQISQPSLGVVLDNLEKTLSANIPGDIVEFGCYIGTTSLFIRRLLDVVGESPRRQFHTYDSFEGLPDKLSHDRSPVGADFKAGELAVSKKQFLNEFRKANLVPPITHKAWFNDLEPQDVPERIAFAFLDGDFYDSILTSLQLVWPRLSKGGVITIDDYQRAALPGVERAVRDFFQDKQIGMRHQHNIAIIRKQAT